MVRIYLSLFVSILILVSASDAVAEIKTGYDLYHYIKLMDNPQTNDDVSNVMITVGYISGFTDGLALTQDILFESVFPSKAIPLDEREKMAKKANFIRLNLPKDGLHIGQTILIYKNYAENYPEKLNASARICLFESLVDSYGWK